jgi:CBS-domain-containing membrane protein
MFAIYDIEGRRFRDTLENLRNVRKIRAGAETPLCSNPAEDESGPVSGTGISKTGASVLSSKAVQAYREMRQLNRREPIYHAHQLMSHPVSSVPMEMGIVEAQRYFQQLKLQQMPVLSPQKRIVGMLSLEDLLQFIVIDDGQMQYVGGKCVSDAMSGEVITADPVSDIRRVAQVMQEYHLDAVPIVDEQDALIGIVSRSDILRAVMNEPPLTMWS